MAFAGKSDKKENVTAAITANIWMSNEKSAKGSLPDETLNYIVLDCMVSSAEGKWSINLGKYAWLTHTLIPHIHIVKVRCACINM